MWKNPLLSAAAFVLDKRERLRGEEFLGVFCSCIEKHGLFSVKTPFEASKAVLLSPPILIAAELMLLLLGYLLDFMLWTLLPSLGLALLLLDQQQAAEVRAEILDGDWSSVSLHRCMATHRTFFLHAVLYILLPLRAVQLASTLLLRARARSAKQLQQEDEGDDIGRIGRALANGDSASDASLSKSKSPSSMSYSEVFGSRVRPLDRYSDHAPVPGGGGKKDSKPGGPVVHLGGGSRGERGGGERYARLDLTSTSSPRGAGKRQKGSVRRSPNRPVLRVVWAQQRTVFQAGHTPARLASDPRRRSCCVCL